MGGRKSQCNQITRDLWVWCSTHNIWLTAIHIPGKQNALADNESREKHSDIEWKLNTQLIEGVTAHWCTPSIDVFASKIKLSVKARTLSPPSNQERVHPLHKNHLTLLACKLSVIPSQQEAFRKKLPTSFSNPGEGVHKYSILYTSRNGWCFAV